MGPLVGIRVIEMKGIGPGPYAGMLLADLGAEVIVVERSNKPNPAGLPSAKDLHGRGKRSIALNLKTKEGLEVLMKLVESADMLFEGFRPGVAERLGYGPDVCLNRNPKLVYGRMTGWGQTGPLAQTAGHDINYISIAGALAAIGGEDKPVPPLNLVGDYAGGSLFLVMGMLAALYEAERSGKGQVVDAAISDGTASLMSMFNSMGSIGRWSPKRQSNLLDGAAHFYDVYETADGKFVSIGPIEPQFYQLLIDKLGLDADVFSDQLNPAKWPMMKKQMQEVFKTKTQQEWTDLLEGSDACFAPVLDYTEAPDHPHNIARGTFIDINGVKQPGPMPIFSRSQPLKPEAPQVEGMSTDEILAELGVSEEQVALFKQSGVIPA